MRGHKRAFAAGVIAVIASAFVGTRAVEGVPAMRAAMEQRGLLALEEPRSNRTAAEEAVADSAMPTGADVDAAMVRDTGVGGGLRAGGSLALAEPAPRLEGVTDATLFRVRAPRGATDILHGRGEALPARPLRERVLQPSAGRDVLRVLHGLHGQPPMQARPKPCRERPWQPRCERDLTPRRVREREAVKERLVVTPPCTTVVCQVDAVIVAAGMEWATWTWHCIISRESDWWPLATGAAGERGLTQIHPVHIAWLGWQRWDQMYNPASNMKAAIELYQRAGFSFSPWSTGGSCGV